MTATTDHLAAVRAALAVNPSHLMAPSIAAVCDELERLRGDHAQPPPVIDLDAMAEAERGSPPIHDDQLDSWEEVARAATDATWLHGTTEEAGAGARQYMIDCFDRGDVDGRIALVHFPAPGQPEGQSMVVAITGNGPTSMANARHIAYSSPHNVILAIGQLRAARAEARAAVALRIDKAALVKLIDENPSLRIRECEAMRAEIARLTAELAAARAVPADVEAAIVEAVDGAEEAGRCSALGHAYPITKAPFWTVPRLKTTVARAISDATAGAVADFIEGHAKRLCDAAGGVWHDEYDSWASQVHDVLNHLRADADGTVIDGRASKPATVGGLLATAPYTNWSCPREGCGGQMEGGEFFDGTENRCTACGAALLATSVDGSAWWYISEAGDEDDDGSPATAAPAARGQIEVP